MNRRGLIGWCLAWALIGLPWGSAQADERARDQAIALEDLRRQVAGQVQLSAYNLLDELVYQWTESPPFGQPTPVIIAGITAPVGLGAGFESLLENHLSGLLVAHPGSHVMLSHCPSCTAVVMHSGPKGTVVSRGLDNPEALAKLGGPGGRHGLYLDVAAEGPWLVLRARITKLTPDLPIVWSRTMTQSVGTPSLLRQQTALKSAEAARREYLDALNDRGPFTVPIRFAVRAYEAGPTTSVTPVPLIWLQTGFELALGQARAWTASGILGYAWLPEAYDGLMVQSRMSRLISGNAHSLTGPDIYLFLGGALITAYGTAIAPLQDDVRTIEQILRDPNDADRVRATFGAWHIGLEYRVGNRIGASVFLENMPSYNNSDTVGVFFENEWIDFHSLGMEVTFCF